MHICADAVIIDMSDIPASKTLSAEKIQHWEKENRDIRKGDIVIFFTGYQYKWALRPNQSDFLCNWPGISRQAAEYLAGKEICAVGTDAMTVDAFVHENYPAHDVFLSRDILIIENLTNLDKLPPCFSFIALPLKIANGSASPIRALALF